MASDHLRSAHMSENSRSEPDFVVRGGDYEHTLGMAGLYARVRLGYKAPGMQGLFARCWEAGAT
jgi:hypothetical protein